MTRVAVLGGGLAGLAAALRAADAGHTVTLVERRARLGGLAGSFRRGEAHVDTGQHVFLRCCDAYRGLLHRLGATGSTTLQDRLDVTVLRPGAPPAQLAEPNRVYAATTLPAEFPVRLNLTAPYPDGFTPPTGPVELTLAARLEDRGFFRRAYLNWNVLP